MKYSYKILNMLVDMIYPPRCSVCNEVILTKLDGICDNCRDLISYVEEPYCLKCGKPLDSEEEYCEDCKKKRHYYDEGRAALLYDDHMKISMYRFKYGSKQEYAKFYGRLIYARHKDKIKSWNAQALIPVPIHYSKLNKRGYNQADLIAKELSIYTKIPVENHFVTRNKATKVQKNLGALERENNLKKAFNVTGNSVKLKSVIIVDDIYTTGSTVDALAKCMKDVGVTKVYYLSVCIGRGY